MGSSSHQACALCSLSTSMLKPKNHGKGDGDVFAYYMQSAAASKCNNRFQFHNSSS
jgi:hypothetical protein